MTKILIDKETVEQVVEVFGGNDWHDEIVSSQWADKANQSIKTLRQALKESSDSVLREQSTEQEPVAFLANGTRYKIKYTSVGGGEIHGLPSELAGRWVALVAADDDCHLKLTSQPQPPQSEARGSLAQEAAQGYKRGYADAMNWKVQNHLEHLPVKGEAAPRKPLTDEEIAHATAPVLMGGNPSLTGIARAIEAAHGIGEKE